ncbi:hypothetical protein SSX86_001750 [Deinandra increscens subsp. villosa]|uniref:Diacylglycerol O-acyltransferase 3 n=1 Tax=Deinandra increscens subsp. villosa TaxID=3103831 RepID=A0AAP0DVF4_9ASTR
MEVTGVVFHQSPCFSPTTANGSNSRHSAMKKANSFRPRQPPNRRSFGGCVVSGEFSDKSHLKYYDGPRMAVKEKDEMASRKKEMKKKLKLLKGLTKNLSTFSDLGFCLHPDDGLDEQVKGQMISEATDVLLGQLQKLKEEEMECKRIKKEEKAKKKASRMMMMMTDCKDSSSSSSESSSDSDCDKVVNMSQLKTHQEPPPPLSSSSLQVLEKPETRVTVNAIGKVGEDCGKKIEVCMGGKCKKSGAAMLLENFQMAVGGEAEVVGCKCMGKCRDGPNVMVVGKSVYIGVGVDDVDAIVSSLFGGSQRSCSDMMVPALTV